jgi:hypothetical protein
MKEVPSKLTAVFSNLLCSGKIGFEAAHCLLQIAEVAEVCSAATTFRKTPTTAVRSGQSPRLLLLRVTIVSMHISVYSSRWGEKSRGYSDSLAESSDIAHILSFRSAWQPGQREWSYLLWGHTCIKFADQTKIFLRRNLDRFFSSTSPPTHCYERLHRASAKLKQDIKKKVQKGDCGEREERNVYSQQRPV